MVRKLSLAIAIALGVTSIGVNALGLGKINSNSALNQSFDANIELLSLDKEKIADIKVGLASAEAFQQAGIERPLFLSRLSFKPVLLPSGAAVILVTSKDLVREPFLNFLVELNWPNGRIQREYTVLLDPPVVLERAPAPVRKPSAAMAQPASRGAAGRDTAFTTQEESLTAAGVADEYGPTRKNDTLWGIATRVRHRGTTMEQTMIALFQANPSAFIKRNINNLKVGKILRVPSREEVLALGANEARVEFRNQLNDWRAGRETPPAQQVEAEPPIQRAVEEAPPAEVEPESMQLEAELKITKPGYAEEGVAGPEEAGQTPERMIEKLEEELIAVQEERESALAEGDELHSRLEELESQLDDLQRLLTLKDDQLARLQAALIADEDMGEPDDAAAVEETIEVPPEELEQEITGTIESEDMALISEDETVPDERVEAVIDTAVETAMETTEEPQIEPTPVIEPELATPLPAAPAKIGMQNLVQRLMADTTLLIGMAVGLVVILLSLLWVAVSRRRASQDEFQESILIDTIDIDDVEGTTDLSEPSSHTTEETSFLSDFSPSDINALQDETGEVDPIAEADVYIAYGRYKQAEELIRQALENSPERPEIQQKLFEILYSTKDADAFTELAQAAAAEGMEQEDPTGWEKVVAMGARLAPTAAIFSGTKLPLSAEDDDEISALQEELGQLGDVDLKDMTLDRKGEKTAQEPNHALDSFDLDELGDLGDLGDLDELADLGGEARPIGADTGLDIDLDLDQVDELRTTLGDLDKGAGTASEDHDALVLPDLDEGEFDLASLGGLDDQRQDRPGDSSAEAEIETAAAGFQLQGQEDKAKQLDDNIIDLNTTGSADLADEHFKLSDWEETDESLELVDKDVAILNLSELETASGESAIEMEAPSTDSGFDVDEVNTKLDLARAYAEMGDAEGASDILNEVLEEGNVGQKAEAQKLLDGMV